MAVSIRNRSTDPKSAKTQEHMGAYRIKVNSQIFKTSISLTLEEWNLLRKNGHRKPQISSYVFVIYSLTSLSFYTMSQF